LFKDIVYFFFTLKKGKYSPFKTTAGRSQVDVSLFAIVFPPSHANTG